MISICFLKEYVNCNLILAVTELFQQIFQITHGCHLKRINTSNRIICFGWPSSCKCFKVKPESNVKKDQSSIPPPFQELSFRDRNRNWYRRNAKKQKLNFASTFAENQQQGQEQVQKCKSLVNDRYSKNHYRPIPIIGKNYRYYRPFLGLV